MGYLKVSKLLDGNCQKQIVEAKGKELPNGLDGILGNEWIGGQDGEFMLNGLENEHAVKWVFMKSGKFWQVSRCGFFEGECTDTIAPLLLMDKLIYRCGEEN